MKVTLVTQDNTYGRYVASALVESGVVDRVLIEEKRASARFLLKKLRKVGLANFLFLWWLNRWFEAQGTRYLPRRRLPAHQRIATVNDVQPNSNELLLGFGSSIVTAAALARFPLGMLNLHTGVLPQYRGVKSEFWALHNNDRARLGWTLHYMTPRLDQGLTVAAATVASRSENPGEVRSQIVIHAVSEITELLREARSRDRAPEGRDPPHAGGRYYTSPTWQEWRRFRRAHRETPATLSAK